MRSPRAKGVGGKRPPVQRPDDNPCRLAGRLLVQVWRGRSLTAALAAGLPADAPPGLRGAVLALSHGALRRHFLIQGLLQRLMQRPPADDAVTGLLHGAMADLLDDRAPQALVVDRAVAGAPERLKGLVNGVLRHFLRRREALVAEVMAASEEARYGLPSWWLARLRTDLPDDWEEQAALGQGHPPMGLRVNRRRADVAGFSQRLAGAGIVARPVGGQGLLLDHPLPVDALPGFAEGLVSVQDTGAQQVVEWLGAADGQRVLDACAAPGGKSCALLEAADIHLLALDSDAGRLGQVKDNLRRLGLVADTRVADALRPQSWWDGRPFDRVLLDAPCSGSGVVRRHPDIRLLRRPSDIAALAAGQLQLLRTLWPTLAPGGKLVYATCSVFTEENQAVVAAFLSGRTDVAQVAEFPLLPDSGRDGFFYAVLRRAC